MLDKLYLIEKWKQKKCFEKQTILCNTRNCKNCEYDYDSNLVCCVEAIDYLR